MKPPRVLVIDDQYGRNATERTLFLRDAGLFDAEGNSATDRFGAIAEAVICSGQREEKGVLINDYATIRAAVARGGWALVLLDVQFDSGALDSFGRPGGQAGDEFFGLEARRRLKEEFRDLPVVMLTGKRQSEIADEAPYLSKHGLDEYELRRALLRYGVLDGDANRAILGLEDGVCAEDAASIAVFRQVFEHARSDVSILLLGESGVGKEVVARYVHRVSNRRQGPFVAVNVAAVPRDLVESELFGIGRKVATNVEQRPGKFEIAAGGTLFLDEIGDMPLETQGKVLRALQERKIVRLGEDKEIPLDIRFVSATSRNLSSLVTTGRFRGDLLYRVNTVPINIAPLRERVRDIAPLARSFLLNFSRRHQKADISFSAEAIATLERQTFPGNVRELENVVERLVSAAGHHQVIAERDVTNLLTEQGLSAMGLVGPILPPQPVGADDAPASETMARQGGAARSADGKRLPGYERTQVTEARWTLDDLIAILESAAIDKDDAALRGIKPRLDRAVRDLLKRTAGAALERCRDPVDQGLNRQSAMRLLTGDASLKGKGPARVLNEILDRIQEHPVTEIDLESLVRNWHDRASGPDAI